MPSKFEVLAPRFKVSSVSVNTSVLAKPNCCPFINNFDSPLFIVAVILIQSLAENVKAATVETAASLTKNLISGVPVEWICILVDFADVCISSKNLLVSIVSTLTQIEIVASDSERFEISVV